MMFYNDVFSELNANILSHVCRLQVILMIKTESYVRNTHTFTDD